MKSNSKVSGLTSILKIALSALLAITLSFCIPFSEIDSKAFAETQTSLTSDEETGDTASVTPENPENPDASDNPSNPQNPEPPAAPATTEVTGLIAEKALLPTSTMTDTISVTPANGRQVLLQKRLSSGLWRTIQTYSTANSAKSSIKLTYPKTEWKARKYTTWRVKVPAVDGAQEYISPNILLYLRNRIKPTLSAKSAIVMNATTGRVLYSKNMNVKRSQASITKVMTAILALENNKLTKKAKITRNAATTPWTYVPINTGNKVTVKNLLYGALLPSSNGCATALAETTSGSVKKFAKLMNAKAAELGMTRTHYVNAHGLTAKGHYSTAYDTSLLMSYALKNPTFKKIVSTKSYLFRNASTKKSARLLTTNRLLRQGLTGVIGGKTGTTNAAGCCFTCAYKRNGQTYVTVVLGSKSTAKRFSDTRKLINYAKKYGW